MENYTTSIQKLQTAILENKPAEAIDLLGRKNPSLPARLGAYIQGYRIRLEKTVANDYPTLKHYLGDAAFEALVRDYVEATPSTNYTIDVYPIGFADYVCTHAADKAAHSLAMLESAIAEVFWLPDSEPFIPNADFNMDELLSLTLCHRTAAKPLVLTCDAESYLQAFRAGKPQAKIEPSRCFLFVVRHQNEVKRHILDAAEYELLCALNGQPFASALETTMSTNDAHATAINQNLGTWLNKWIQHGFFVPKCY